MLTEANGLLYMRARYYSPDMMRFINEDIVTGDVSNSNSLNRYSYVEGNPVTMVDPFGLCGQRSTTTTSIWNNAVVGYNLLEKRARQLVSYYEDRINKPAPDYSNCNPADYPDYTEMIDEWMYGKENEFIRVIENSCLERIDGTSFVDVTTPVMWFYNQVKDDGPMDIKKPASWSKAFGDETWPGDNPFVYHDEVIDKGMLGNITYGYVGAVYFSETVLEIGGGVVETKHRDNCNMIEAATYSLFLPNYGEAPEDCSDIAKGVRMYEERHK